MAHENFKEVFCPPAGSHSHILRGCTCTLATLHVCMSVGMRLHVCTSVILRIGFFNSYSLKICENLSEILTGTRAGAGTSAYGEVGVGMCMCLHSRPYGSAHLHTRRLALAHTRTCACACLHTPSHVCFKNRISVYSIHKRANFLQKLTPSHMWRHMRRRY